MKVKVSKEIGGLLKGVLAFNGKSFKEKNPDCL